MTSTNYPAEASARSVRVDCLDIAFKSGLSGAEAVSKANEIVAFVGEDSARLTAVHMAGGSIERAAIYAAFISG